MKENKNHWYDGWFYDKIIAPNQDNLFGQIKNLIEPQSTIIDVGCGTGRFPFAIASRSNSVLGIDLSKRNINTAQRTLNQNPNSKITFKHSSLKDLVNDGQSRFDYAILTYVIHEVNEEERVNLLKDISKVANKIIIGDYLAPQPKGFSGLLTKTIEFVAGSEHYRNFKTYLANGGIDYLAKKAELKIISEITNQPSSTHIAILTANKS